MFPALVENRGPDDPIRIWVPGCSTGEEAYSIAICLTEFLEEAKLSLPFEIFATDISETAIEKARAGIYTDAALAHVSPQRLGAVLHQGRNADTRLPRASVTYAFLPGITWRRTRLSPGWTSISCCNVLIYLGAVLQRKVLSTLHYALKPSGFLVLGPSESIGTLSKSVSSGGEDPQDLLLAAGSAHAGATPRRRPPPEGRVELPERIAGGRAGLDVLREADRLVLAEHGPPGAIIDEDMNIVQVRGRTAPYLELSPGEPTHNLLKMAREGLIAGLGKAIRAARKTNAIAKEDGFRIEDDGQLREVAIKVIPFTGSSTSKERYFLVLFEDAERETLARGRRQSAPRRPRTAGSARLRRELAATKEYLQSIVDDNATTLEELRAANEEAQAGNEELETARKSSNRPTKN